MSNELGNRPPTLIVGSTSSGHTTIDITKTDLPNPRPANHDREPENTAQDAKVTVPEQKQRNRAIEHVSNTLLSALLFLLRPQMLVVIFALALILLVLNHHGNFPLSQYGGVVIGVGTGLQP
ncbi:hypothetical protein ACIBM3_30995 [Rhodococcus erythropolis]|uniref:hypothetical protein n=1 Tax=Rhodococcus erythropolis TaxID=1833 RepID=UPI0037AFF427